VWEATSPEKQQEVALWERVRKVGRRQAACEATSPEDQAQLDAAHEALRAAERDRKAGEKMAALRGRLHNPPSPDAPELIGAIMALPELLGALDHRLRADQDGTFTATHQLTAEELGVLCVCLHLLRESAPIRVEGMSTSARWPRREPPLVATPDLRGRAPSTAQTAAALVCRPQRYRPRHLRPPHPRTRDRMGPRAAARQLNRESRSYMRQNGPRRLSAYEP
jgi:hypothetical protein